MERMIHHSVVKLIPLLAAMAIPVAMESFKPHFSSQPKGDVHKAYDLLGRVLSAQEASHFRLKFTSPGDCGSDGRSCFSLRDDPDSGELVVTGTTVSEITAGIGHYLRQMCNVTIGWPRGGGSSLLIPQTWPTIGTKPLIKHRVVPWSYLMNVCTHSYTLVWYDWADWERFIDWLALSGINNILALTGQEEIQYKVFQKLGLSDMDIRTWFNGPAFRKL